MAAAWTIRSAEQATTSGPVVRPVVQETPRGIVAKVGEDRPRGRFDHGELVAEASPGISANSHVCSPSTLWPYPHIKVRCRTGKPTWAAGLQVPRKGPSVSLCPAEEEGEPNDGGECTSASARACLSRLPWEAAEVRPSGRFSPAPATRATDDHALSSHAGPRAGLHFGPSLVPSSRMPWSFLPCRR